MALSDPVSSSNAMPAISSLRLSLTAVNGRFGNIRLGDPQPMQKLSELIVRKYGIGRAPDSERMAAVLHLFMTTGVLTDYRQIHTACYGFLERPLQGQPIAHSFSRTAALLNLVEGL